MATDSWIDMASIEWNTNTNNITFRITDSLVVNGTDIITELGTKQAILNAGVAVGGRIILSATKIKSLKSSGIISMTSDAESITLNVNAVSSIPTLTCSKIIGGAVRWLPD